MNRCELTSHLAGLALTAGAVFVDAPGVVRALLAVAGIALMGGAALVSVRRGSLGRRGDPVDSGADGAPFWRADSGDAAFHSELVEVSSDY